MSTYTIPRGGDVAKAFASLPTDTTEVLFGGAHPVVRGDIVLPSHSLMIDGKMERLDLGPNSNGFVAAVTGQADANVKIERKFVIRNFDEIKGGKKAVDLSATFMSRVEDVELVGQAETAIDLRFCLMATVQNTKVTLNKQDGIRVRCGDWSGAGVSNSQSNSATIDRVRIYNGPTSSKAFAVQHANSCRMVQCVSEGYGPEYDLWLSATSGDAPYANNPVVKQFSLDGFHVEHGQYQASKASVWVDMPSKCAVELKQCYWNYTPNKPVILYSLGQLILEQVGWWTAAHTIESRIQSPRITVRDCNSNLSLSSVKLASIPIPGNTVFTPAYVTFQTTSK